MCCICNVIDINKTGLYFTCALSWLRNCKTLYKALGKKPFSGDQSNLKVCLKVSGDVLYGLA